MTDSLDPLLRQLADADAGVHAPPHVERTVMQAWDDTSRPASAAWLPASAGRLPWVLVPAAAVLVAAIVAFDSTNRAADPLPTAAAPGGPDHAGDTSWYVLVNEPAADAGALSVVRLRMSRTALASLGVPVPNPDAAALVDVDVVLGEDGVARAIQPVTLVGFIEEPAR